MELPYLARRNIDVVGTRQVVVIRRAQEAEAVGQDFQHALAEDRSVLGGLRLQHRKDHLLLAHVGGAVDVEVARHLRQLCNLRALERLEVEHPFFADHRRRRRQIWIAVEIYLPRCAVGRTRIVEATFLGLRNVSALGHMPSPQPGLHLYAAARRPLRARASQVMNICSNGLPRTGDTIIDCVIKRSGFGTTNALSSSSELRTAGKRDSSTQPVSASSVRKLS